MNSDMKLLALGCHKFRSLPSTNLRGGHNLSQDSMYRGRTKCYQHEIISNL